MRLLHVPSPAPGPFTWTGWYPLAPLCWIRPHKGLREGRLATCGRCGAEEILKSGRRPRREALQQDRWRW